MVFIPSRDLPSLSIRDGLSVEEKLKRIQRGLEEIARALGVTIASGGGQEGEAQQHHVWVNSSEWKKRNAGQGVYLQEETGSEGIDQDRGHADDSDEHVDGRDDDDGDSDDDEDDFETRFVNEWLPRVACLKWLPLDFLQDREEKDNRNDPEGSLVTSPIDEIINAAARLIAICAGQSASGKSVKLYHFGLAAAASSTASQEEEDEEQELAVKVRDDALVQDSLGSRTWGAAPLLASHLLDVHLPSYIVEKGRELQQHHRKEMTGRILELGSGTGLVGLAAFLYLRHRLSSTSGPASSPLPILHHVHLTDSNPDVMRNLQHNMTLNDHNKNEQVGKSIASSQSTNAQGQGQVRLHLSTLDWSNIESSPLINEDKFDLIIAADCIYEPNHAALLRQTVERFLSTSPSPSMGSTELPDDMTLAASESLPAKFIMLCTVRPTHQREIEEIYAQFPLYTNGNNDNNDNNTNIDKIDTTRALSQQGQLSSSSSLSKLTLCITHEQDHFGYDDFGPPKLHLGDKKVATTKRNRRERMAKTASSQRVLFREFVIQWCRTKKE